MRKLKCHALLDEPRYVACASVVGTLRSSSRVVSATRHPPARMNMPRAFRPDF